MSAPPYMKLYIADYLADTTHLTRDEHGAYLLLLMALWRAGGKLPRNPEKLARIARCTPKEWSTVGPTVLEFFKVSGGSLTQKRASEEIAKYEGVIQGSKAAGKASASKRAKKNNEKASTDVENPFNGNSTNHNQNHNQKEDAAVDSASERVQPSSDWPDRPDRELVSLVASPWLDPSKSPGLVTTSGRIVAWKRDGASWEHDVVPVITGMCAKARRPIANWSYFDGAVAQAIADNRKALELPEARTAPVPFVTLAERRAAENEEARRLAFARMDELAHG